MTKLPFLFWAAAACLVVIQALNTFYAPVLVLAHLQVLINVCLAAAVGLQLGFWRTLKGIASGEAET